VTKLEFRDWRDASPLNKFLRVILYAGIACFNAFWFISVWLETVASYQPDVPTGVFTHAYAYKGRIGFLNDSQARVAHIGDILGFSAWLGAPALIWFLYDEQKASNRGTGLFSPRSVKLAGSRASALRCRMVYDILRSALPVEVQLESPFSPDDCVRKLRRGLEMEAHSISGWIRGTRLRAREIITYRNSFQTVLSARLLQREGRTLIRCRFSMALFPSVFLAFWLGAVGLFLLVSIAGVAGVNIVHWHSPGAPWSATIFSGFMFAFGIGLLCSCRVLARDEQHFLLCFIRDRVGAQIVDRGVSDWTS